ncbi:MAG: MOSC domain-containing protein [Pseudomonadales bacterium]
MLQILSVNVGRKRRLDGKGFSGDTGILKMPSQTPVAVGELGLEGDAIVHTRDHGGPDQAVYMYRSEDYDWWSDTLGEAVPHGAFGDNLTVAEMPSADAAVGTRLRFETVELEVTAPRIPCNILAARMGDPKFLKRFIEAERPGFYCRVIRPGTLRAGASGSLSEPGTDAVTILDMFRASYHRLGREELERLLAAPIDERSRARFEAELRKLLR